MDQVNLQGHGQQKMRQSTAAPRKYDGQQGNPLYDSANGGHYGQSRPPELLRFPHCRPALLLCRTRP